MFYYATIHKYDVKFANDQVGLIRFKTKRERDALVSDEFPDERGNYHIEALTRDDARHVYPMAFKIDDWRSRDHHDERDWMQRDSGGEYWEPYEY